MKIFSSSEYTLEESSREEMDWHQVRIFEQIFFNFDLLSEIIVYLRFSDIYSLLIARISALDQLLLTKTMKRKMMKQLMGFLIGQGWESNMPLLGSREFESSQEETMCYMDISIFLDCDVDQELNLLTSNLMERFPVTRNNKLKTYSTVHEADKLFYCQGDNFGKILTIVGGSFSLLSPSAFVISGFAESTVKSIWKQAEAEDKVSETTWKSHITSQGCLNEAIIGETLRKLDGGAIFNRLQLQGIHIDSVSSIWKLEALLHQVEKTINSDIFIDHVRVSCSLGETGWAQLCGVLTSTSRITWNHLETTSEVLSDAREDSLAQLWNVMDSSVLLMPNNFNLHPKCFSKQLGDWNYVNLVKHLSGKRTSYAGLIDFLS